MGNVPGQKRRRGIVGLLVILTAVMTFLFVTREIQLRDLDAVAERIGVEDAKEIGATRIEAALQKLEEENRSLREQIEEKNRTIEKMAQNVDEISSAYDRLLQTIDSASPQQTLESLKNAIQNAGLDVEKKE
uniref:hypothetical protein n=1 Tax=Ndongobacter massiliensis TaxID=1871025 RepID=UPI000931DB28|nr:hypothetical protein [Ndongobacter massiliensis]